MASMPPRFMKGKTPPMKGKTPPMKGKTPPMKGKTPPMKGKGKGPIPPARLADMAASVKEMK